MWQVETRNGLNGSYAGEAAWPEPQHFLNFRPEPQGQGSFRPNPSSLATATASAPGEGRFGSGAGSAAWGVGAGLGGFTAPVATIFLAAPFETSGTSSSSASSMRKSCDTTASSRREVMSMYMFVPSFLYSRSGFRWP